MKQWFEENGYDVIVMGAKNTDGRWRAMAAFSAIGSRGEKNRQSTTCVLQNDYSSEKAAFDAAAHWALATARTSTVRFPKVGNESASQVEPQ